MVDSRARMRWRQDRIPNGSVLGFGTMMDPDVLTIGFARRFTGYKRPNLITFDLDRLKRMVNDPLRPVQFLFAGKSHPADTDGKRMIQTMYRMALDPEFGARIGFVEEYDHELAAYMVQGVDVWLNNPLPPLEASGTSGMKAGINGTPNLSILDGWWAEGYNGRNGWAFGGEDIQGDRTQADAEALYALLEQKVIPTFYRRDDEGIPREFVKIMKASIKSIAPLFGTRRMVKEYTDRFYVHALGLDGKGGARAAVNQPAANAQPGSPK
jgi:starch phosphorylase